MLFYEVLLLVVNFNTGGLRGHSLEADLSQQHGEGNVVLVQHTSGYSVEHHLQERNQTNIYTQLPFNLKLLLFLKKVQFIPGRGLS